MCPVSALTDGTIDCASQIDYRVANAKLETSHLKPCNHTLTDDSSFVLNGFSCSGSPQDSCQERGYGGSAGCLRITDWCQSTKAVSCKELGGLSNDVGLCSDFNFWSKLECGDLSYRCSGGLSGQCVFEFVYNSHVPLPPIHIA